MKKYIILITVLSLILAISATGYCAKPVSFENGDFTIDGITINDNIKTIIAKKGKPSLTHQSDKNSIVYQYKGKYTLLAKSDKNIWYIATNTMPTARNIKVGMTKGQMFEAYGDQYELIETRKNFNYEYLGENTKLVFITNRDGVILQIDCKRYK